MILDSVIQMLAGTGLPKCDGSDLISLILQALERCKEQEEIIEGLMTPLEELRSTAHAEFDQVDILRLTIIACKN